MFHIKIFLKYLKFILLNIKYESLQNYKYKYKFLKNNSYKIYKNIVSKQLSKIALKLMKTVFYKSF